MKRVSVLVLLSLLVVSITACGKVTTKDEVKPAESSAPASTTTTPASTAAETPKVDIKPQITIVAVANTEKITNIVRDQLVKNGFDVKLNLQPDYASATSVTDAGNFDLYVNSWTTVTGNPDYAIGSVAKTDGSYNRGWVADPKVDELIAKAASETPDKYVATYKELEDYMIGEKAYFVPLYRMIKTQGINSEILKPETVKISNSRSLLWEEMELQDSSKSETDPIVTAQTLGSLTSLDPVKGNDGSINMLNTNMYVRLVNLSVDDDVISEGSLSYNYSIQDDNANYYFILRDDINFSRVENMEAVDTGVRVGAEDAVFSLTRAKDKDSVPLHKTYNLHENMQEISIVTDMSELENAKSSNGSSVKADLEKNLPAALTTLTDDKTTVNNANGVYQVVKITTKFPFPQVLNYLAHQSAGVLCKEQVESINTFDPAEYDPLKHIAYGDQVVVTEGATYDNHLWASGPYILTVKNDYEAKFTRNPGYMPTTKHFAKTKNITVRFISDNDSILSAFRSGELGYISSIPEEKVEIVKGDSKLVVQEKPSNGVCYLYLNVRDGMSDENLRKAILYSINQDEIIAVFANRVVKAYSTLTPLVDTGNELVADSAKVAEYLSKYAETLNK